MFRQIFKYLLCFSLCFYLLVFGCGVNVIHYCCSACAEVGVSRFDYVSCAEVHAAQQCHHHSATCGHHHEHYKHTAGLDLLGVHVSTSEKCCSLDRFEFQQIQPLTPNFSVNLVAHCLFLPVDFNFSIPFCQDSFVKGNSSPPLLVCGRSILQKKSLLLI